MARLNRTFIVRTASLLCLLGIGISLGTVVVYHLIWNFFRRQQTPPPNPRSLDEADPPASTAIDLKEDDDDHTDTVGRDENSSVLSLQEYEFESASNPDFDYDDDVEWRRLSIQSDNSNSSFPRHSDSLFCVDEQSSEIRQRKSTAIRDESTSTPVKTKLAFDAGTASGSDAILDLRPTDDSERADERALSPSDGSASVNQKKELEEDTSFEFHNLSLLPVDDFASEKNLSLSDVSPSLWNRTSIDLGSFGHSTPDDHGSVFKSWRSGHNEPGLLPSCCTIDCEVEPVIRRSFQDCGRYRPGSSRGCMSIDLGDMSSSFISELLEGGILDCNSVSSMEKLQAELNCIQVEMRDMTERVGKLQSHGQKSFLLDCYNICPIELSVDDDDYDVGLTPSATSPRRKILRDMHSMSCLDASLGRLSNDYVWDDFDADTGLDVADSKALDTSGEESVGQLESFVQYQNNKVARDSLRRMSVDVSQLNRSDSSFLSLTPLLAKEPETPSCSLFNVNRRLSGQFLLHSLSSRNYD